MQAGSQAEANGEHEAMKKSTQRKAAKKTARKKPASRKKRVPKKAAVRKAARKRGNAAGTVSRRGTGIVVDLRHAAIDSALRHLGK